MGGREYVIEEAWRRIQTCGEFLESVIWNQ